MISSRLLKPDQELTINWLRNILEKFNEKFDKITERYGNALRLALSHRKCDRHRSRMGDREIESNGDSGRKRLAKKSGY